MKKILMGALLVLAAALLYSCEKDGDGTSGFWECDLSKDAAEYVTLDWSSAAEYQSKIVPGTLLSFYTSVVGADRGKIKTTVGGENNAGLVVTTMVRLN